MHSVAEKKFRPLIIAVLICAAGLSVVWGVSSLPSLETRANECLESGVVKMTCFTGLIDQELSRGGLPAAFDAIAYLYDFDRDFASVCHGNVHELGDAAYHAFLAGEELQLSPKASYCGYGFFHGFMEKLISAEGSADRGIAFCKQVGEELRAETTDAEGACYHGIGHGAVDGTYPETWGNPQAMVAPGLALCERIFATSTIERGDFGPLYRCVTGAYNSLEVLSQDTKYGLQELEDNPFEFCSAQRVSYRPGCYTNMLPILLRTSEENLPTIVQNVEALPDEWGGYAMRQSVVADLVHEFMRIHLSDPKKVEVGIGFCRSLNTPFQTPCIEGLAGGSLKYGPPEREYEGALEVCASVLLTGAERGACYGYVLPRLRNFYSEKESRAVCAQVPEDMRAVYCTAYE